MVQEVRNPCKAVREEGRFYPRPVLTSTGDVSGLNPVRGQGGHAGRGDKVPDHEN
ncbi:hypothetical protein QE368_000537 [Asaia bogorensis NBRC 16594]|nr:hypothetical protein [Asaia bogorensis NBRC 16594]